MTASRTLSLRQVIDPSAVVVQTRVDRSGAILDARLDLSALPRIEGLLRGRDVASVPRIVERLCGLCPVAHQLAGVAALEALWGLPTPTAEARAVRRLLHVGDVLRTHARTLAHLEPSAAAVLGEFARATVTAAGGSGHFPRCAVPGGVAGVVPVEELVSVGGDLEAAEDAARRLVVRASTTHTVATSPPPYRGHDVALVDEDGVLDLYGGSLAAVAADGTRTVVAGRPEEWETLVAEEHPGVSASRPYLVALGPDRGRYRVGPVAQLRAATRLPGPGSDAARRRWLSAGGGATWARAVVALHLVESIAALLPVLLERGQRSLTTATEDARGGSANPAWTVGTGWIDGSRGLLAHTYHADAAGVLQRATIVTPTAQNEPWLADLLLHVLARPSGDPSRGTEPDGGTAPARTAVERAMEVAIREADPCLPCTSMPPGQLAVTLSALVALSYLNRGAHVPVSRGGANRHGQEKRS